MVSVWAIPVMLFVGVFIGFCVYGIFDPQGDEYEKGFNNAKKQYEKTISYKCLDRGLFFDLVEIIMGLSSNPHIPDEYRKSIDGWAEKFDSQGGRDADT